MNTKQENKNMRIMGSSTAVMMGRVKYKVTRSERLTRSLSCYDRITYIGKKGRVCEIRQA